MESSTKSLRPRKNVVDYKLNASVNTTPKWLKKSSANYGCWDEAPRASGTEGLDSTDSTAPKQQQRAAPSKDHEQRRVPHGLQQLLASKDEVQPQDASNGSRGRAQPGKRKLAEQEKENFVPARPEQAVDDTQDQGATGKAQGRGQQGKRKLNHSGPNPVNSKATKRPKQPQRQQQEGLWALPGEHLPQVARAPAKDLAPASGAAHPLAEAAPAAAGRQQTARNHAKNPVPQAAAEPAVPRSVKVVLESLPDGCNVNIQLQEILQRVLHDYHSLKESTILDTEAIIAEQARRYEAALEAKDKLAKRWQEQAERNKQFLNVNCVQDFKEQIAQLEASLASSRVQQQEVLVLKERLEEQLQMQSLTADHLREQLENRGRRVEAAEQRVKELQHAAEPGELLLKSTQATMQDLQAQLDQAQAEAAELQQRLLKPARPRCRNVALMARPTTREVELQTDLSPAHNATTSVGVGPDEPLQLSTMVEACAQCPSPSSQSPGIGVKCPSPLPVDPRSPLAAPAGLTLEDWQAIWFKSQDTATQHPAGNAAPSSTPLPMDVDEEDDSPVRGLTNGSPLKQPQALEHTPVSLCPEGIQPHSSERLPFAPAANSPPSEGLQDSEQATLHCSPMGSPCAPSPSVQARPVLGLPPAAGARFAGSTPAAPAVSTAEQQPVCSTPGCFAINSLFPLQQQAPDYDRISANGVPAVMAAAPPQMLQLPQPASQHIVAVQQQTQSVLQPVAGQVALVPLALPTSQVQLAPEFSFPATAPSNMSNSLAAGLHTGNSACSSLVAMDGRPVTRLSGMAIKHDSTCNTSVYTDAVTGFTFRIGQPSSCIDSGPATPGTPGLQQGSWQQYKNPLMFEVLQHGSMSSGAVTFNGSDVFVFPADHLHVVLEGIFSNLQKAHSRLTA